MRNRLAQIKRCFLACIKIKILPFCRVSLFATAAALFPVLPFWLQRYLKREVFMCCDTLQLNPFSVLRCFLMLQQFSLVAVRNTGTG